MGGARLPSTFSIAHTLDGAKGDDGRPDRPSGAQIAAAAGQDVDLFLQARRMNLSAACGVPRQVE